jgi:hypothetical protein
MTVTAGDCETDADCRQSKCVEVTPGGFRVCLNPPPEATSCNMSTQDQCCSPADCKLPGRCYLAPQPCTGPVMLPHNVCMTDQCQSDMDCLVGTNLSAICVEPGVFGRPVRSCVPALCRIDTDCTEEPSGICAPVTDFCCGSITMACVYPSNGCRGTDGCNNQFCVIQGSRAQCVDQPPLCPL